MTRHIKEWIITETIVSGFSIQNAPLPATLANQRRRIEGMTQVDDYTLEARCSILLTDPFQITQEASVILRVGIGASDTGVASGVNTGFTIESVNLKSGVIGDTGQTGSLAGVPSLNKGILYKS